ncbi:prenyltransferase/squalene oxidase repeat-containing protein [Rossellomorea vietnamensis]|uniref:prenyltransferase/squalene oxidase repeat-containing protein n=1 Tax=Rossellomorea vietnamensis TaxID=218284 RepID=UPI003CED9AEC
MKSTFVSIIMLVAIAALLISCENKSNEVGFQHKRIVKNINEEWAEKTKKLIKTGQLENGEFFDYSSITSSETSIDETYKSVFILKKIDREFNEKELFGYLENFKPENEIDKIKVNAILSLLDEPAIHEVNYDQKIAELIEKKDISREEILDEIFIYHLYNNNKKMKLSTDTRNLLKDFLSEVKLNSNLYGRNGYLYDLVYLCRMYEVKNEIIDKTELHKELIRKLSQGGNVDLIELYYLSKVNILLETEVPLSLYDKIRALAASDGTYAVEPNQEQGSMLSTYLVVDLLDSLKELKRLDIQGVHTFVANQQDESGGFKIRKVFKPNLTAGILAESSLKVLGNKTMSLSSQHIYDLLENKDNNLWKLKYYGFELVQGELTNKQKSKLKEEVDIFWDELSNIQPASLAGDLNMVENLVYSLRIYKGVTGTIPESFKKNHEKTADSILSNYKNKEPVEIMLALELKKQFQSEIENKRDLKKYLIGFYNSEKNQFIYKEHSELVMNYFIIKSLMFLDYDFDSIDLESLVFKYTDSENGGFNTIREEFTTSSLITTFYGINLLDNLIKY